MSKTSKSGVPEYKKQLIRCCLVDLMLYLLMFN
uniref:Uncharacterized protein n=1 Tax=Heterorhabditis bacteriophora TaxID=37862 RepID=A0A1I7XL64_HETBA